MVFEEEIWKDIPGYEGLYQASSLGRIKALHKVRANGRKRSCIRTYEEKIMRQRKMPKKKYLYVNLCKDGIIKSHTVHRLIARVHVPNPDNLPVVNHLDTDTFNNRSNNLGWDTHSGNSKHAFENGLLITAFGNEGVSNPTARRVQDEATGKQYDSIVDASKESRFSIRSLYHQLSGTQKKKTTLKFIQ